MLDRRSVSEWDFLNLTPGSSFRFIFWTGILGTSLQRIYKASLESGVCNDIQHLGQSLSTTEVGCRVGHNTPIGTLVCVLEEKNTAIFYVEQASTCLNVPKKTADITGMQTKRYQEPTKGNNRFIRPKEY